MKANKNDIVIRLRLSVENNVHPKELVGAMDMVESALYDSDRRDVELLSNQLRLPSLVSDACLERLRHYRHNRLVLSAVKPGSIELFAVVAAVSYFVVKTTAGEAIKTGYQNSELHSRLSEYFQRNFDKLLFIAERLRGVFKSKKIPACVRVLDAEGGEPLSIIVDIHGRPISKDRKPGTIGEELDKL